MDFDHLYTVTGRGDHLMLLERQGPVHGSLQEAGCAPEEGLWITLRVGIEDPRNDIVFVGYNAQGTPGRGIQQCASAPGGQVTLEGEKYRA